MMSRHATGPRRRTGLESGAWWLLILDDDPDTASTIVEIARSVGFVMRSKPGCGVAPRSRRDFPIV